MAFTLLTINGSLRTGSVNAAVLGTAAEVAPPDIVVRPLEILALLPHFNPDEDREPLPGPVEEMRRAVAEADAVLFCSPEYAGGLPGSFKNLLDWLVGSTALRSKPVAWINAASAAAPAGGRDAYASLRKVMAYVEARVIEPACVRIPVPRHFVRDGRVSDPQCRRLIADALIALCGPRERGLKE